MIQKQSALRIVSRGHQPVQKPQSLQVQPKRRIAVNLDGFVQILDLENISRLQASSNYCFIFLKDGDKVVVSKTLGSVATNLPSSVFVRIHQSHVVNLASITEVHRDYVVVGESGRLPLSRSKRKEVNKMIKANAICI